MLRSHGNLQAVINTTLVLVVPPDIPRETPDGRSARQNILFAVRPEDDQNTIQHPLIVKSREKRVMSRDDISRTMLVEKETSPQTCNQ